MAGSGGSLKEMVNRYQALNKLINHFCKDLVKLKSSVESMNNGYWNGGQTANSWYESLRKAYKSDRKFCNKMVILQKKMRKLIGTTVSAAGAGYSEVYILNAPSDDGVPLDVNITNTSVDDIYIDGDNVSAISKNIKTVLGNMCNELSNMKKNLEMLRDHPKVKGKVKKAIGKLANGVSSKYSKTKSVKNSLETSLVKSIKEYEEAINSFDEIDNLADELGYDIPSSAGISIKPSESIEPFIPLKGDIESIRKSHSNDYDSLKQYVIENGGVLSNANSNSIERGPVMSIDLDEKLSKK